MRPTRLLVMVPIVLFLASSTLFAQEQVQLVAAHDH